MSQGEVRVGHGRFRRKGGRVGKVEREGRRAAQSKGFAGSSAHRAFERGRVSFVGRTAGRERSCAALLESGEVAAQGWA